MKSEDHCVFRSKYEFVMAGNLIISGNQFN